VTGSDRQEEIRANWSRAVESLAAEHGRAFSWLFELRGIGDYGETCHVPEADVAGALLAAAEFVDACGALLREKGFIPAA